MLTINSLSIRTGDIQRLVDINLHINEGELVGLIGPNGAGKSTLLKAMAGLENNYQGNIYLKELDISNYADHDRAKILGYFEQNGNIHWPLRVDRLVQLGRTPHLTAWNRASESDQRSVEQAMEKTDIVHLRNRIATSLSGGEKCRVLLARVFAGEPKILLVDEPIASLDPAHQFMVMHSLRRFVAKGGTVVIAIHDLTIAARFCTQLVLLDAGRVRVMGSPSDVITHQRLATVYGIRATIESDASGGLTVIPYDIANKEYPGHAV